MNKRSIGCWIAMFASSFIIKDIFHVPQENAFAFAFIVGLIISTFFLIRKVEKLGSEHAFASKEIRNALSICMVTLALAVIFNFFISWLVSLVLPWNTLMILEGVTFLTALVPTKSKVSVTTESNK